MHHLGSLRVQSFRIWSGSRGFLVQNLPGLGFQPRGYQRSRPTGAVATCHGLRDWHVLKNGVDLLKLPDFEMQELSSCKSREFRETPSLFRVRSKSKSRDRRRRVLWIGIGQRIGHYHAHRKGSGGGASCGAAEQSFCAKEAGAKQARVSRAQEDGVGRREEKDRASPPRICMPALPWRSEAFRAAPSPEAASKRREGMFLDQ